MFNDFYRELYGIENVVLSDIVRPSDELLKQGLILTEFFYVIYKRISKRNLPVC
jgi:hypothetical protein